jgi:ABC-type sugar transport system substrate-binding protein
MLSHGRRSSTSKRQLGSTRTLTVNNQLNINQILFKRIANGMTNAIVSQPIDKAAFTPVMQQAADKGIYQATFEY